MEGKNPIIVSISSGKGGVGKTFVAVNLATLLARFGKKVLTVDCDLGLANIDIMLGIHPAATLKEFILADADVTDVVISTRYGFDFVPASSGAVEMTQLLCEDMDRMKEALGKLSQNYDFVILDTGAGISESVLQFNLFANKNVIVLNRELTSLTDAYATIKVIYQAFGRDRFNIIVNTAKNKEEATRIFQHIDSICTRFLGFSLHFLGYIVHDETVPISIMKQQVLADADPQSAPAVNCSVIAEKMVAWHSVAS